jgi:hypothetical protein
LPSILAGVPLREVIGKFLAFGISAGLFIVCGFLVLTGAHAADDYLNKVLGFTLLGLGAITAGFGVLSVAGIIYEERAKRAEHALHVTPRAGEPAPPPAWGMGNVGRVVVGTDETPGKGGAKVMSVAVNNLDAPLIVAFLFAWTLVALLLFSPK